MVTALIVAGGSGSRMGADRNKLLLTLSAKPVIWYTLAAFERAECIDEIVIAARGCDREEFGAIAGEFSKFALVCPSGDTRQDTVRRGLAYCRGDIVAVHDGARALVMPELICRTVEDCRIFGAAAAGVMSKDTIKLTEDGFITATVDRERAVSIQTPQVFRRTELIAAHEKAAEEGFAATDDCMLLERLGKRVRVSEGSYENIKLTTPEDMELAEKILQRRKISVDISGRK